MHRHQIPFVVIAVVFLSCATHAQSPAVKDISLLVAPDLPCFWSAGLPPFQINHYLKIGPLSAYNSDILTIDEHTGTQLDSPAHFVPRPETGLPQAGEMGYITADKVPVHQLCGEACVIDCRDLLDKGQPGKSSLITKERIAAWEKANRKLGLGDVVIFHSGFSDKHYKPFPAGRGFVADPIQGRTPGWPDPDPDCMFYLATQGVRNAATDSPSMGPLPGELAAMTHVAGLRHGMVWTEGVIGVADVPTTGAFYAMIGPKHKDNSGGEGRALIISQQPLAGQLIAAARKQQVVDLSVVMAEDLPVWWPGAGVGNHRQPYYTKVQKTITAANPYFAQTHTLDSHTGTHLVPPSYSLPRKGFDDAQYAPEVQGWLKEYETKYGPRGTSEVTTEQVPLSQTCGWARVIEARAPVITEALIKQYEQDHGALNAGEIVIFQTGHSDRYFKPFPAGDACIADPLNGKSAGWAAPDAAAIVYLASRGIRCVATDAPSLGSVDPKQALMTYWALGSKGLVGVEYLTGLGQLKDKAFFIFAPVKIRDCHGGPGRAIALMP